MLKNKNYKINYNNFFRREKIVKQNYKYKMKQLKINKNNKFQKEIVWFKDYLAQKIRVVKILN